MSGAPDSDQFVDPLSDYEPQEYSDHLQQALAEECIPAIKSSPFAKVTPDTKVRDAVKELQRLEISSLAVVNDEGKLVGIFTERDMLEKVAEQFTRLADHPVSEVMTSEPIVVYDCDPSGAALAAIAAGGYRHVPVLSVSGELVGIISPRRVFTFVDGLTKTERQEPKNK